MLDTVKFEFPLAQIGALEHAWRGEKHLREGLTVVEQQFAGGPARYMTVSDGPVRYGTKTTQAGHAVWCECSIGNFLNGHNRDQLTQAESELALDALMTQFADRVGEWSDQKMNRDDAVIRRADFYFQRYYANSGQVLAKIATALGRGTTAVYQTGVQHRQSRQRVARFYDKGVESKNADLVETVRWEEQFRGKNHAGFFVNAQKATIDRNAVRAAMNERFKEMKLEVEVPDLQGMIRAHRTQGAAACALLLCPGFEGVLRESTTNGTFYRIRNIARAYERRLVRQTVEIPDDAWQ